MDGLLIVNARIVNEGAVTDGDVRVRDGRIERMASGLDAHGSETVIDAGGRYLLPGMIDLHVHFREPGGERKGTVADESSAAVAGGVTTCLDMPNTNPPTTSSDALEAKIAHALKHSHVNYAAWLGATPDNLDEIQRADPERVCGIKVYMGSSTGSLLVDQPPALERLFEHAPLPVAAHCEDTASILEHERLLREQYGDELPPAAHTAIRNEAACVRSTRRAIELAARYSTRLHILHVSTAREVGLIAEARESGALVSAEACVPHLSFDTTDYKTLGFRLKCNPAVKSSADREALWGAVYDGRMETIGTDHAPHAPTDKEGPYGKAASGMPSLQQAMPALLDGAAAHGLPLERLVERTAHAPAKLMKIRERGFIREGYWADLILIDPGRALDVKSNDQWSKCGWSPFEGRTLKGTVDLTVVSGRIAWQKGKVMAASRGESLVFSR